MGAAESSFSGRPSRMDAVGTRGRVLLSTVSQTAVTAITALLAIVALRVATKHLGPHHYGQLVTVTTFVSICSVVTDLGLNGVTVRNMAKRPEQAGHILSDNLTARGLLCLVALPVMGAVAYLIYPAQRSTVVLGVAVMSIDVLFGAVNVTCLIWYSAQVRNEVSAALSLLNRLVYTAGVIGVAALGTSLLGYIGAVLFADGLTAALSLLMVGRHVRVRLQVRPHAWRRNMSGSLSLGLLQIAATIFLWVDSFLISIYKGPQDVAFYGIAVTIVMMVNSFSSNFMAALLPSMSRSSEGQLPAIMHKAFAVMLAIAVPTAVGGILLRRAIIELIAGPRYLPSEFPLAVLLASVVLVFVNSVYGYACVAINRVRLLMWVQLPAIAINVALNVVGIPRYGIDAAAFATLITEILSFLGCFLVFRAKLGVTLPVRDALRPALAAGLMVAVSSGCSSLWQTPSAIEDVLVGTSVLGAAYTLALIVLKGVPEEIANISLQSGRRSVRVLRGLVRAPRP